MDPSTLAGRLRAIVSARPGAPAAEQLPIVPSAASIDGERTAADVARVLGGTWHRQDGFSCFVVERRCQPERQYGRDSVGAIAARLRDASGDAPLLAAGAAVRPPFVFLDVETTGLSGGAGTYPFLVGCGGFADDGAFLTRQLVLLRQADERPLLQMLGAELARAGALVTFNGKSFDAPLIETRYLFHRLEWQGSQLAHLDVLHPARRFWNDGAIGDGSCSLLALEQEILGARRGGDVAGFEVPARYFRFIRTGNPQPLVAVLEHNRLDLLSLAGLTARLLELVRAGSGGATRAREALALGRVYWQSGLHDRACKALEDALAMAREAEPSDARGAPGSVAIDALRALALLCRRRRRYDEAAAYWREMLANPMCPAQLASEASEALAIHHEHRARDLAVAKAFALRSLSSEDEGRRSAWNQAVRHRVARIEKKMGLW
jgi:hypothetical protein